MNFLKLRVSIFRTLAIKVVFGMIITSKSRQFVRKLDLSTLELFALICQTGSIGAASKEANLAISTISKRIQELENLIQIPIFTRHSRGVHPTPAGVSLLRHARSILRELEDLRADMDEFSSGIVGHVHVYASASAVEQYLADEIAGFVAKFPEISIDLSQATTLEVINAVQTNQADFGICNANESTKGLESIPFKKEELVLIAPKNHPLAKLKQIHYLDALPYEHIGLRGSSTIQQLMNDHAEIHGLPAKQRLRVESLSALCRMVEAGLGIGVIPKGVLIQMGDMKKISSLKIIDSWSSRELFIYARSFANLPSSAQKFIKHLS